MRIRAGRRAARSAATPPLPSRPALALFAAALLLGGCATRAAPRPGSAAIGALPAAQRIFDALAQRRAAVRSVRAMARLSYTSPDESRKAKQLLIAERPDRLRLEILSPFGTMFVLTTADGTLAAWTRDESTVYRGAASAENLQRYTQVDLPIATAVDLLLGTPPLRTDPDSVVSADDSAIELWQQTGSVVRVGWFSAALQPLRYEQRDPGGRVLLRATFDQFADLDGGQVPTALGIELPLEQRHIDIALSEPEVNPVLPATVFALETPAGSKEVDLDQVAQ
jgi:outer membrane biogenesis lipoprotein LolB